MRLGYKHTKANTEINKYWDNTIVPLLNSGHLESAITHKYIYPNRVGLYPGLNCQFFCNFCGRNYNAKYGNDAIEKSFDVFKRVIDEDPRDRDNWQDRFRISGGLEPLTNPRIGDIIQYGTNNEFNMQMYTNGYALTKRLLDKQPGLLNLEVMRISLYGHNDSSYTSVTKIPKSYNIVKENLRNFLQNNSKTKVGVNWIILPGHAQDVLNVFDMIEDINSTQDKKIQFITLREDFSQNAVYLGDAERAQLIEIFQQVEERCAASDNLKHIHIDYGYQLDPIRHGKPNGPLKMAQYNEMNRYGFPQIATAIDSLGNLYVYHETGFIDRPGANRYIIGNIENNTIADIVQQHINGKGIPPKPFDVSFLDAFDHTISLVLADTYKKDNWKEILEEKWK